MEKPALSAAHDFAVGLAIGYQWADTVGDAATRERFIDAAVVQVLAGELPGSASRGSTANLLAASILGVHCDDDAAEAFWWMIAPGADVGGSSHWFFEGFIYGAAELFSQTPGDEFAELRNLIPHPPE